MMFPFPLYSCVDVTTGGTAANPITCNCGEDAILLTVRKQDSVNKGW